MGGVLDIIHPGDRKAEWCEGRQGSEKEEATVDFYRGSESYTPKVHQTSLGLAAWHTG